MAQLTDPDARAAVVADFVAAEGDLESAGYVTKLKVGRALPPDLGHGV